MTAVNSEIEDTSSDAKIIITVVHIGWLHHSATAHEHNVVWTGGGLAQLKCSLKEESRLRKKARFSNAMNLRETSTYKSGMYARTIFFLLKAVCIA